MKVAFVYFDVGGVILNYEHAHEELSRKTGKPVWEIDKALEKYSVPRTLDINQLWEDFKRDFGLVFSSYEEFVTFYTGCFVPIQSTHKLIKELAHSYPVGLLSNTEPQTLETSIRLGKIPDVSFSTIVASCYVGSRKPERKIYEIAKERSGVEHEKILFIDDMKENIAAAKAFSWQALWFDITDPEKSVEEIRKYLAEAR